MQQQSLGITPEQFEAFVKDIAGKAGWKVEEIGGVTITDDFNPCVGLIVNFEGYEYP